MEKINEIKNKIDESKSILLHCHPSPDPDSVGSSLAMMQALKQLGKKVTVIQGDSEIPKSFAFPGIETILKKNFFEVDLGEFDLFIILDSGGIEMVSAKGPVIFPDSLTTIVIDHHASNKGYGNINYIDSGYSSTCELLFNFFNSVDIRIDHDIALNLFMGIYTDTGGYRYGNTPVRTLDVASKLSILAPEYQRTISIMENSNRKESLVFEGLALSSFKTYLDGKFATSTVSFEDITKNNILSTDYYSGSISNKIKSVLGVEISATLIEVEISKVKVSFRSKDAVKYDVSKLATSLGGGGHKMAAGVVLKMPLKDAVEEVVKSVKELYNI